MLISPSPLITEANYKCKQLQIHMTQPMWLLFMRMICRFGAQSSFGSTEYSKKNIHPLIFFRGLVDPVIRKVKVQWQIFMCPFMNDWGPLIKSINAEQNMYSISKKIPFGLRKSSEYKYKWYLVWENCPNTNTNNIRFEKIARIRIRIIFGFKKSPEYKYEY